MLSSSSSISKRCTSCPLSSAANVAAGEGVAVTHEHCQSLTETILKLISVDLRLSFQQQQEQQHQSSEEREPAQKKHRSNVSSAEALSFREEILSLDTLCRPADARSLSKLSLFQYSPGSSAEQHVDRGLLTLVHCPDDAGLVDDEGIPCIAAKGQVIVLAGSALQEATGGTYRAASHAVAKVTSRHPRVSLVYRARGNGAAPARCQALLLRARVSSGYKQQ